VVAVTGSYEEHCAARGLIVPAGLTAFLDSEAARRLAGLLYRPDLPGHDPSSLASALELLHDGAQEPFPQLLPIVPVDDMSLACVVCASADNPDSEPCGWVVRWHLDDIPLNHQAAIIDSDAVTYLESVARELAHRDRGRNKVAAAARKYKAKFLTGGRRPEPTDERPVQLACQNVIIGLAVIAHEPRFDGLRVSAYVTCEVPHVVAGEADRALAALLLCDTFQNGGTMEVRFDRHPEKDVPASLQRFARSRGFELGKERSRAISPREARTLFLSITPMPDDLERRVYASTDRGIVGPERLCFTLLRGVFDEIALDYLLATSARVPSILTGGAEPGNRTARQAENESNRSALMASMLYSRLDTVDTALSRGGVRVFEDGRKGITWRVDPENGAVLLMGLDAGSAPWLDHGGSVEVGEEGRLVIVPRGLPMPEDVATVARVAEIHDSPSVLVVPRDVDTAAMAGMPVLRCPERLSELDLAIEGKLTDLRVSRA
jgi:hypothetical protein